MTGPTEYLTVTESAAWLKCSERTIRRWMNASLLTIYRRGDGKLVLDILELARVEREQRHRNPVRNARRAERFAQVASMSYPRGIGRKVPDED